MAALSLQHCELTKSIGYVVVSRLTLLIAHQKAADNLALWPSGILDPAHYHSHHFSSYDTANPFPIPTRAPAKIGIATANSCNAGAPIPHPHSRQSVARSVGSSGQAVTLTPGSGSTGVQALPNEPPGPSCPAQRLKRVRVLCHAIRRCWQPQGSLPRNILLVWCILFLPHFPGHDKKPISGRSFPYRQATDLATGSPMSSLLHKRPHGPHRRPAHALLTALGPRWSRMDRSPPL